MRDAGSVSYSAAIESACAADTDKELSAFAGRVQREATPHGFDAADRRMVIGDGAKWIWKRSEELYPGVAEIVDLNHAKGTLSKTAKKISSIESEEGETWARAWRDQLEEGKLRWLLKTPKDCVSDLTKLSCARHSSVSCVVQRLGAV